MKRLARATFIPRLAVSVAIMNLGRRIAELVSPELRGDWI